MKLITSGQTRIVLLTDRYAVKIARIIRIRYCLERAVSILRNAETAEKFSQWREESGGVVRRICKAIFVGGLFCNYLEHKRSKEFSERCKLVPTVYTIFWIINIQRRGMPATAAEIADHPLIKAGGSSLDDLGVHQFCIVDNKPLLADYGNPELGPLLMAA